MPIFIDGYNVFHGAGILDRGVGPGNLQRARMALLNFLAESLDPEELSRTTVVFDSNDASWGLPKISKHRGIVVHFAAKYESADEMIEELILADSAPRRLTVVSSDHEIQRVARRRKATAVDSDVWYADLVRARRRREETLPNIPARPPVPLLAEDVDYWLRQFGGESALMEWIEQEIGEKPKTSQKQKPPKKSKTSKKPQADDDDGLLDNPFPPGYGEDLLEEF